MNHGIIYTSYGGFVDVAHIRDTIDRTHYAFEQVRDLVRGKQGSVTFEGPDLTTYHVTLSFPANWSTLKRNRREAIRDQLSVRLAQQIAYDMMTWHEVQTWYGYRSSWLFDEKPSAFTYDDIMSHWVGITAAGRALQQMQDNPLLTFDATVTKALRRTLGLLGPKSPDDTDRRVMRVEDHWWKDGLPIKRQLHVGLFRRYIHAWLVPDDNGGAVGEFRYPLPSLDNIGGESFTRLCSVEVEPRCWEAEHIRGLIPGKPIRIDLRRDLPTILDDIRTSVQRQNGVTAISYAAPGR